MHQALSPNRWASWPGLALLLIALFAAPIGAAQSLPDLTVADVSTEPERIEPERPTEIVVTVANEGRSTLLRPFNVNIQVDGELIFSQLVSGPLSADQTVEVSGTWETPTEGEHRLRVRLDPFNRVQESDEENNELRTTLTVEPPQRIRSFTSPLLDGMAVGLIEAGNALQVEPSADTFQLIESFQAAFDTAESAYGRGFRTLNAVAATSPDPFQTMPQMAEGERVAQLYGSMATDFEAAKSGLARAQVQPLLDAFGNIRSTVEALGGIAQPEFDLRPLAETSALLDEALVEAGKLQDALNGVPNVDVEAATSNLVDLMTRIGGIWLEVGTTIQDGRARWSSEIADRDGAPIERYEAGDPLVVTVPTASSLTLFIYNDRGERVYAAGGPRRSLVWHGIDSTGETLEPGTYFYRLLIGTGASPARVELGEIRVQAPRED